LRETQPIDSDKVGDKSAQKDTNDVSEKTEVSDSDDSRSTGNESAGDKADTGSASPEETTTTGETADNEQDKKRESADDATQNEETSSDISEESDQETFESQPLSKESRSTEFQGTATSSKVSVSQSAGATERPPLPKWLIQGGAVFIGGSSLLAMIGLTLNLGAFGITSTHAGIVGVIFGIIAIAVERLQNNNWLADGLFVLGLGITLGLTSGAIGLNALSVGSGLIGLGVVLGILDRV
jgi:hypothetical protein